MSKHLISFSEYFVLYIFFETFLENFRSIFIWYILFENIFWKLVQKYFHYSVCKFIRKIIQKSVKKSVQKSVQKSFQKSVLKSFQKSIRLPKKIYNFKYQQLVRQLNLISNLKIHVMQLIIGFSNFFLF